MSFCRQHDWKVVHERGDELAGGLRIERCSRCMGVRNTAVWVPRAIVREIQAGGEGL
ncbi:MAG: hypothetical protein V3W28_08900 [Thermoplasmata archaeon]